MHSEMFGQAECRQIALILLRSCVRKSFHLDGTWHMMAYGVFFFEFTGACGCSRTASAPDVVLLLCGFGCFFSLTFGRLDVCSASSIQPRIELVQLSCGFRRRLSLCFLQ